MILGIIASSIFHIYVTLVALATLGMTGAALVFLLPGFSALYLLYIGIRYAGFWNNYTIVCIMYVSFLAIIFTISMIQDKIKWKQ